MPGKRRRGFPTHKKLWWFLAPKIVMKKPVNSWFNSVKPAIVMRLLLKKNGGWADKNGDVTYITWWVNKQKTSKKRGRGAGYSLDQFSCKPIGGDLERERERDLGTPCTPPKMAYCDTYLMLSHCTPVAWKLPYFLVNVHAFLGFNNAFVATNHYLYQFVGSIHTFAGKTRLFGRLKHV